MKLQRPVILNYYESLEGRNVEITKHLDEQYQIMRQGFEGEKQFLKYLQESKCQWFIHDLQIKLHNQVQFDFIAITDDTVFQFEIKNFSGDYFFENQRLYRDTGFVAKNIISQYEVAHNTLRKLLHKFHIKRKVKSYVVFINETFTLTGELRSHIHLLLHSELYKLKDMLSHNFKYDENEMIYKQLMELHKPFLVNQYHFKRVALKEIAAGVKCIHCGTLLSPSQFFNVRKFVKCKRCGHILNRQEMLIRALYELYILKGEAFTLKEATIWTGVSRSSIKRILYTKFERIGSGRMSKYKACD